MKIFEVRLLRGYLAQNEKMFLEYYVAKDIKDVIQELKMEFEDENTEVLEVRFLAPVLKIIK